MVNKYGYIIKNRRGRNVNQRIMKTRHIAKKHIKAIIKNNSLKTRRQAGYLGLKILEIKLNKREIDDMKRAKEFIRM